MEHMRPIESLGYLPRHSIERRSDLLLVRWNWWRTENEVEDFEPRLLHQVRVLRAKEGLSEVSMTKVDPVELSVELPQVVPDGPFPRSSWLPAMVSGHPRA